MSSYGEINISSYKQYYQPLSNIKAMINEQLKQLNTATNHFQCGQKISKHNINIKKCCNKITQQSKKADVLFEKFIKTFTFGRERSDKMEYMNEIVNDIIKQINHIDTIKKENNKMSRWINRKKTVSHKQKSDFINELNTANKAKFALHFSKILNILSCNNNLLILILSLDFLNDEWSNLKSKMKYISSFVLSYDCPLFDYPRVIIHDEIFEDKLRMNDILLCYQYDPSEYNPTVSFVLVKDKKNKYILKEPEQ